MEMTYPDSWNTASSSSQTTLLLPAPPLDSSPLLCTRKTAHKPLKNGSVPVEHHFRAKPSMRRLRSDLAAAELIAIREPGVNDPLAVNEASKA